MHGGWTGTSLHVWFACADWTRCLHFIAVLANAISWTTVWNLDMDHHHGHAFSTTTALPHASSAFFFCTGHRSAGTLHFHATVPGRCTKHHTFCDLDLVLFVRSAVTTMPVPVSGATTFRLLPPRTGSVSFTTLPHHGCLHGPFVTTSTNCTSFCLDVSFHHHYRSFLHPVSFAFGLPFFYFAMPRSMFSGLFAVR